MRSNLGAVRVNAIAHILRLCGKKGQKINPLSLIKQFYLMPRVTIEAYLIKPIETMINYNYIGKPDASTEEKATAKKEFTTFLGPFKKEFEEKDGFVAINLAMEENNLDKYSMTLGRQYDLSHLDDFTNRLEQWLKESAEDKKS